MVHGGRLSMLWSMQPERATSEPKGTKNLPYTSNRWEKEQGGIELQWYGRKVNQPCPTMFSQKFFTAHVKGLNDCKFYRHTFQGAMVTFNVYAIFPETGQEWKWSQTLLREIINSFQAHLPLYYLQHSCPFNPGLPLHLQVQWSDKELANKELESSRKIQQ